MKYINFFILTIFTLMLALSVRAEVTSRTDSTSSTVTREETAELQAYVYRWFETEYNVTISADGSSVRPTPRCSPTSCYYDGTKKACNNNPKANTIEKLQTCYNIVDAVCKAFCG